MKRRRPCEAFTLIELITVIAIIGIITAIALPILNGFRKGDAMLAATRQMLDAVGRARQLAISQHTTVYLVFAPPTLWQDPFFNNGFLTAQEKVALTNVLDKQLTGFAFVSLRSVGDQPGRNTPRYLSEWHVLPEKAFIPDWKFNLAYNQFSDIRVTNQATGQSFNFKVRGFDRADYIPFPSEAAAYHVPPLFNPPASTYAVLPYIAFDYLGRLASQQDEYIPLAHGSVNYAKDPLTKALRQGAPSSLESPLGNSTNISFNLIHIDWLTGRARLERSESR